MDVAKVAKDYFLSSQSSLLIPNREFGSRKLINVGLTRSSSAGNVKLDSPSATIPETTPEGIPAKPAGLAAFKGLLIGGSAGQGRGLTLRQKSQAMRSESLDMDKIDRIDFQPSKGNKQWQHPPEALLSGHILYTVKFLGECTVEQPKGTDVVKDAIRKMKFNKHIRRAEGQKPPKVELTISADAVSVLDPKSKQILHQYPLHRISYCADDKSDKRMFTFIAKEASGNSHFCYVFDSEKCAEEITLTIGQAFDLAYRRFLETTATDGDVKKQFLILQKRVQTLQFENDSLRKRVAELEKLKDRTDVEEYKRNNQVPRQSSVVGRRLENLMLNEDQHSSPARHTNGTHNGSVGSPPIQSNNTPILSPPPSSTRSNRTNSLRSSSSSSTPPATSNSTNPFFGSATTSPAAPQSNIDPFGMEVFSPPPTQKSQQELIDIQAGFSRGLSFGTEDFNLDDLDPLNQRT